MRPHLLIFEPDPRGHSCEWIEHLLAAAPNSPEQPILSLVVAADLAHMLGDAVARAPANQVRVVVLTPREQALCTHHRLAVSAFARWWLMRRYLQRTGASAGMFLQFDHLSLPLGLGLRTGRPVSGVLFRPSVHYGVFSPGRPSAKERLRDGRKDMLYRLMLANPSLRAVLSLDPYFPEFAWQRYRHGEKVLALPDPAFPAPAGVSAREPAFMAGIPKERALFVLFGELTARKGVLPLIEALAMLPADAARRIAVIVAGRLDAALRPTVQQAAAKLALARRDIWFRLEDRRLGADELAQLVSRSDVILAPYQRFVGSSGILMWAARTQRPVICQDYGLLGHLTRRHALGLTVDTTDAGALSGSIALAARRGPAALGDPAGMAAFAASHTVEHFALTLLRGALRDPAHATTRSLSPAPRAAPK